ncbi:MAG: flagellar hook-basal body complex protein, partial [Rhodospirillales bacterium]|nr:flagellar hook-basal body complex protein [Rhodospirillales bacterium]
MNLSTNIATSRLIAQQRAIDVAANNMANANTPGFKVERMLFSDWLSRQRNVDPPAGGRVIAYTQDRATWREDQSGTITHTANPFDLALTGDGFFTVQTPQGKIDSVDALLSTPVTAAGAAGDPLRPAPQLLSNLAVLRRGEGAGLISHYNVQPVYEVCATVQDRDLGGAAADVRRVVDDARASAPGPIAMPPLPEVGPGRAIEPGVVLHESRLPGGDAPGWGGKLWLYLPEGEHAPRSLPCVMITAA